MYASVRVESCVWVFDGKSHEWKEKRNFQKNVPAKRTKQSVIIITMCVGADSKIQQMTVATRTVAPSLVGNYRFGTKSRKASWKPHIHHLAYQTSS